MRRHGFTTHGPDIQTAVFRAVFAVSNAQVQTTAALLRQAYSSMSTDAARTWTGESNPNSSTLYPFEPLTAEQARDCEVSIGKTSARPWGLWVKEVESNVLYVNEA